MRAKASSTDNASDFLDVPSITVGSSSINRKFFTSMSYILTSSVVNNLSLEISLSLSSCCRAISYSGLDILIILDILSTFSLVV